MAAPALTAETANGASLSHFSADGRHLLTAFSIPSPTHARHSGSLSSSPTFGGGGAGRAVARPYICAPANAVCPPMA
jgi:hypothetical protein